jgi:hypothetical protein
MTFNNAVFEKFKGWAKCIKQNITDKTKSKCFMGRLSKYRVNDGSNMQNNKIITNW